ncbi:hypothetical protein G3M48_006616 [Beauveria asiatica]|uniref:Non-haem dioxygenase N-terminal domain-containing protein n=1 Tax=Beauveria asiatica TaxID=1069075 RepID=A0AAW0RNS5_9HYPO
MDDFTAVPVIDLSLAQDPATKPRFLSDLQAALVRVGFFYIKNHAVPHEAQQVLLQKSASFFRLPTEKKLEFDIARSKHFSGYSRMVNETTAGPGPGPGWQQQQQQRPGAVAPGRWAMETVYVRRWTDNVDENMEKVANEMDVFLENMDTVSEAISQFR